MTVRLAVRLALQLLDRRDRRLLSLATVLQMGTSLLDLAGILLIGVVGALAVTTIQSQPPPPVVGSISQQLGLGDLTDQALVVVFAAIAAFALLLKTLISSVLARKVLTFLANRQALVTARLCGALLSRPLTFLQMRSSQELSVALITGTGMATIGILGQFMIFVSELTLLVIIAVALLAISPAVAVGAIAFFGLVAVVLQRTIGGWAQEVGATQVSSDIQSYRAIQEAMGTYRELAVLDRRLFYVERIQHLRWTAARAAADGQFIGLIPKYLLETSLVIGGLVLASILFSTEDAVAAVGTLALFLAAGSRVLPSLLRLQGAAIALRSASGAATPTFELADALGNPLDAPDAPPDISILVQGIRQRHEGLCPSVELSEVSVIFPGADRCALSNVNLSIQPGQRVAFVGRSGAGKSTLADVILGVIEPDAGAVLVAGQSPAESARLWPGGIAYVPQSVMVVEGTVRDNVALGLPRAQVDDLIVWSALRRAHLADYLLEQRDGLDTVVGERGLKLSGGQRQRLGIARALFSQPRLLVMDEATSALDAETESAITDMINEFDGDITTILIAHRLSTVRHSDVVVYLDRGKVLASGTFEEVSTQVPEFALQAKLMGLDPRR